MPTSNGIITSPINISDVSTTLGVASLDIGTLCTSSSINKWAKYKPVNHSSPMANLVDPSWWKSDDGNCGFKIPSSGNIELIKGKDWTYQPPKNGDWFRILDFNGYYHNAEPFIKHNYKDGITINKGVSQTNYTFNFIINFKEDEHQLSPYSFSNGDILRRSYLSVYIYNSSFGLKVSANNYFVNAQDSPDAISIKVPTTYLQEGTFTCMFFLSTYKYIAGGGDGVDTCLPFPSSIDSPSSVSLKVINTSALRIEWTHMSYSKYGIYKTLEEIEPMAGIGDYAWVFKSYGDVWAKVILTCTTGTATISLGDITLETLTFHGTTESISGTMYDESFNKITNAILLNAGQVKTIYIEYPNALIMKKGNPTIPSYESPGFNSQMLLFSDLEYRKMNTGGHAYYYAQYSTSNAWSWEIIKDDM